MSNQYITTAAPVSKRNPISANALLVHLYISQWSGKKIDGRAANTLTNAVNAKANSASVVKHLLGADCAELNRIHNLGTTARTWFVSATMPWMDRGTRLLPVRRFVEVEQELLQRQQLYYEAVDELMDVYSDRVAQSRVALGAMFDETDCPTPDHVRAAFSMRFRFAPVPESGDFRVDVSNEQMAALMQHYATEATDLVQAGLKASSDVAVEALRTLSDRLDALQEYDTNPEARTTRKPILRDSVVEHFIDAVDMLEANNVAENPSVSQMATHLRQAARSLDASALRSSVNVRDEAATTVNQVLATLPSLDF